ncbi:MAG: hypothetical protein WAO00_16255 [Chthoniobacterales bacterium]
MKARPDARRVAPAKGFEAASVWNVAVCLAAFVFTCLVLHAFLPLPKIGNLSAKLRFFAAHKDEFDTIFLGSSRIHCGVAPSVFDQVLAENGIPSRSFNFGATGMYPPEEFHVLDQILALNPRNLKRLFLEIDDIQGAWLPSDQTSQRLVSWHNTKSTWILVRKILDLDVREPFARKLELLRYGPALLPRHLVLWARNISNQGRGFDLAESFAGGRQIESEEFGPKRDGHFPAEGVLSGEAELAYERDLAREEAVNAGNVALDRYADRAYRHYAREIRRLGARPIFVVTPTFPDSPSRFSSPPPGLVLAYNSPSLYPDFYRPSVRVDPYHLNSAGAIKLSTLIALDFLRKTGQP